MNKIKATKKEMKENYYIIGIGYCSAQYLLREQNPIAYSAGRDGWRCDYYLIDDVIISTGYSYLDNKHTSYDYEKLRKLDQKARAIVHDYSLDWKTQKRKINRLLKNFVRKAKEDFEQ